MAAGRSGGRALVLGLGVAWALVAGACTRPGRPPARTTTTATTRPSAPGATVTASGSEVRSPVPRETVAAGAAGPASAAVGALGASLYRGIAAGNAGENIVFSPFSVESALAMVRNGAAGQTRAEMDEVLGATGAAGGDTLDRALNALDTALRAHDGPVVVGPVTGEIGLRTSNALWAQDGMVLYAAFLDALARHYGAGVEVVDFIRATEAARARINAYVAERTNGRIPTVLPAGSLTEDTRFVLTNTVWFKAPWAKEFSPQGDLPFHRADGTTVNVPTMATHSGSAGVVPGRYGSGEGWKAAEVPYLGGALSMVVIVPDDLARFEAGLDGARLAAITGGLDGDLQSVQMPRWRTRTSTSLPEQLAALGLRRAFSDGAEFTDLSPTHTKLDDVIHQAFVAVDEKGTEAAAATAVIGGITSVPVPRGTPMVVDRPFVYAIRDVATGAVLFLGRVVDPSKVDS
jgi:serpin B